MHEDTQDKDLSPSAQFIFTIICALACNTAWPTSETVANAAEEVIRAYKELDDKGIFEEIKRRDNDTEKNITATQLFNPNMLTDSSLSTIDKAVYFILCVHADTKTYICSPKVKIIAEEASCSERTVHRSLNVLEKLGIIQRIHRFSRNIQISSLYKIRDFSKEA